MRWALGACIRVRGTYSLTSQKVSLNIASGRVVSLIFTNRVTVASGETNDAHLDRFLVHWIHSHRRATEHDATIQHPPRKFNLVLARATSRYHAQVERTQKSLPPFGWDTEPVMGTEVVVGRWALGRRSWMYSVT